MDEASLRLDATEDGETLEQFPEARVRKDAGNLDAVDERRVHVPEVEVRGVLKP